MKFSKKGVLIVCGIVLLLGLAGTFAWYEETRAPSEAVSPMASSTPSIGAEKPDLIRVFSLKEGDMIQSPLRIEGEARGNWFFEASFPIRVLDGDGNIIGLGIAEAKADWMTEDFVPFEATIEFYTPRFSAGTLVLAKDNPSGLPEYDDELRVPVVFSRSATGGTTTKGLCYVGGCSSQICSDKPGVITTCEYTAKYACYKNARCERQPSGVCGWSPSPELQACLKNPPPLN